MFAMGRTEGVGIRSTLRMRGPCTVSTLLAMIDLLLLGRHTITWLMSQ